MEIGNQAKLKQPVVQGLIVDTRYRKDAKQLEHLVHTELGDRWFLESQLELVPVEAPAETQEVVDAANQ